MKRNAKFFIGRLIILFIFLFLFSLFFKKETKEENSKNITLLAKGEIKEEKDLTQSQKYCNFFPKRRREDYNPQLNEKAGIAVLFDKTGKENILYKKNTQEKLPIASLTKLMTAIVVFDNYDLENTVEVSQTAINAAEETGKLRPGERISIGGLLDLALMVSSNDAAQALSEVMGPEKFVKEMNKKAENIGLSNTHFSSAHGLETENYSTAEDLAMLTQYSIVHYPKIWKILGKQQTTITGTDPAGNEIVHSPNNTNKLLSQDYVLGGKTGYTEEAGDTMILAMESPGIADGNIVLVLLGLGVSERMPRIKNFYDWIMWGWNWGYFKNNQ